MNKEKNYKLLLKQAGSLLQGEHDLIANMSNISALLFNGLPEVSYAGFYRSQEQELILGPFQGPVACMHIQLGRGVCGKAAETGQIQIVPNVHEFSGHIACDANTNSEIVVPIIHNKKLLAVLDLDSNSFARFDQIDAEYLQKIADLVSK
ncbi:GAF domain-containing protein [Lactobacillus kimbladii]|uniref:GAF domain-containing protein n=1 Tax=Lactobacillus kimbladii TaxID=1218506 RepID=UPI003AF98BE2